MSACCSYAVGAGAAPVDLVVSEGFRNPIGFYDATPTFSWKLPANGEVQAQTAYHIVVATSLERLERDPDLWDSGRVNSDQSVWIPYAGKALASGQKVSWRVKFWDEKGRESEWTAPASFELGLLENADWKAQWIRMGEAESRPPEPVSARKSPKLVIIKAVYGVKGDPARQIDLTKKFQQQVASGNTSVKAGNEVAGSDPAFGVVKTLDLEYRVDGKAARKSIPENGVFDLATGKHHGSSGKKTPMKFVPEHLRREFELKAAVRSARLHVTAKGVYEVYLNGHKVGKDYMAPGWTPYHKRIETLTYDVTDRIQKGANVVGAILGEGWYAGAMMRKRFVYPAAKPMLLLRLEITLADGSTETVVTDSSWKACNAGPIRYSSIYHGEVYDAAMEMPGWNQIGFDDSAWAGVILEALQADPPLVPKRHYPVRATEELATLKLTEPAPGRYVFDLGQNMVGWPRLSMSVNQGEKITVRFAEMLNKDGTLYTANYRAAHSTAYYTPAKTGTVTWHPTFTFFGYRYVELSGLPEGSQPQPDWVTGVVLHSAFPQSGTFRSSHALLNKLQKNITWGQRGNYLDIPTDCPQRDERLGWTGDAQVFGPTSLFNYDVHSFWMSWLQSLREEQKNGLIPNVVPDTGCGAGSPGWGDVGVVSPWDVYVRTGHRDVLEENYDMMKQWTAAYERQAKNFIVTRKGYGDWLVPYKKGTGHDYISTAYFGRCARIMEQAATALGKQADAARYRKLHGDIRAVVSSTFFDTTGKLKKETQTGYLMFLGYDLLKPELRSGAVTNLLKLIDQAGGHLGTGFLGTPLIALVLEEEGHADVAYQVVFKETYPSWFYSIHQGATTMWERWNSYSHDKGFGNAGMNSFNHYAYGAVGQWMYERVAGLAPDAATPGYKHFFIQPHPGGPLTQASAELETPYGKAASGWEKRDDGLVVRATVPPNTTATLIVPTSGAKAPELFVGRTPCRLEQRDGTFVYPVGPGTHEFMVR
ncbi:MAG: family 78 glycoside hydrolase catalytic domain [Verrucomicrobia bacterium]|nr:family 78 glycoside hydrolase catalytic domain [Verrucomicrobiota bacterium]MBT7068584.1 family 78 glycoside hydrolase catalytic domain [Verrucomicrobiota bacterium]MBT7699548.1 family 78 glycoside hydrolase catalytic domain [Verrucomicrobiota bacterium]